MTRTLFFLDQLAQRALVVGVELSWVECGAFALDQFAGEHTQFFRREGQSDLEKIRSSLNTICSHCGASIPPEDQNRVDFEHMKCPRCCETFIPKG